MGKFPWIIQMVLNHSHSYQREAGGSMSEGEDVVMEAGGSMSEGEDVVMEAGVEAMSLLEGSHTSREADSL